jgi:uncharacterized membrane protein YebE (DUF533 family)
MGPIKICPNNMPDGGGFNPLAHAGEAQPMQPGQPGTSQPFDPKSILDALMRGGAQPASQQGDLGDFLRKLLPAGQAAQPAERAAKPPGADRTGAEETPGSQGGRSLEDMLRNAMGSQSGSLTEVLAKLQQQGGSVGEILGQILGQATSGVREGANRIDEATGASRHARDAMVQATGRTPEEMLAQLKQLLANNKLGAGAALGGLGALVLGTGTGRSLAGSAVKLGSLALIGGLAYKAYQNYQQGRPLLTGGQALLAAPVGSGFEPGAVTNESAALLVRAMIAAAAADGRIDEKEQQKILGGLKQAGLAGGAEQFLAHEISNPATVDDLANAVSSPAEGVEVYTAARITVEPDIEEEHDFLVALADRLGIDENLAAHIDAVARGASR